MNQLVSILLSGAAALALSVPTFAADPNQSRDESVPRNQAPVNATPPGSVQDSVIVDDTQAGAAVSAREQEYLASLKKCESLNGQQRQQCVDAARKKAGNM